MPLFSFEGRSPQVHPEAWVAPTATLVGDVVVEAGASIWYGVVLRADFGRIVIRAGANVQDNSVLHGGADPATEIGPGATVGHVCVVHGAVIGAEALIGNGVDRAGRRPDRPPRADRRGQRGAARGARSPTRSSPWGRRPACVAP